MADIINRWNINGVYYQIHDYGRGLPGGVATLDDEGRIPYQQLPLSTVTYKGAWEADVNVPDLTALTDVTKGDMYVVISSGRQNLNMFKYTAIANPAGYNPQAQGWYEYDGTDYIATTDTVAQIGKVYYSRSPMGSVMFLVGDRVIWDGQQWERVPAGGVTSVNGKSGDVVLTGEDVAVSPDTATSVTATIKDMDYNSGGISGDFISNIVQTDGKITSVTKGSIPAGPSVTDTAVAGQYVSAVSQSNGKISVTRGNLPTIPTQIVPKCDVYSLEGRADGSFSPRHSNCYCMLAFAQFYYGNISFHQAVSYNGGSIAYRDVYVGESSGQTVASVTVVEFYY